LPILFELENTDVNRLVANFLSKAQDGIRVLAREGKIRIESESSLEIDKLTLGSAVRELSDKDWVRLYRQISKSVENGRVWPPRRNFDKNETWIIRVHRLKTKDIHIRLASLDYDTIKEAAAIAKKNLSDFIRSGALKLADEVTDREIVRRQAERGQQARSIPNAKTETYVA
jgi:hypothetical protein